MNFHAVGQTIASLSHHIKNILQGIRGGSYLIQEGLKQTETELIRKGWGIVEKNQEKISSLVMDMLTFSKDRQPEMLPCDLHEIVGDVLEFDAVSPDFPITSMSQEAVVFFFWLDQVFGPSMAMALMRAP